MTTKFEIRKTWRVKKMHQAPPPPKVLGPVPAEDIIPTRIFDQLSVIGDTFVYCFVLETTEGLILIDNLYPYEHYRNLVEDGLVQLGLNAENIKAILITHGHFDHFGNADYFRKKYGAKIYMSKTEYEYYTNLPEDDPHNPIPFEVFDFLEDGDDFTLGETTVHCVGTGGHSPGVLSFIFPVSDEGQFQAKVTMPVGTRKEQTKSFVERMGKDIEEAIGEDLKRIQTRVRYGSSANKGEIRVQLRDKSEGRKLSTLKYMGLSRKKLSVYPAKISLKLITSTKIMGNSSSDGIDIDIVGEDLDRGIDLAEKILVALEDVEGLKDVRLRRDDSNPELNISINRDLASKMGLNMKTVASSIKTGFGGTTATRMTPDGSLHTDLDVQVQLNQRDRINIDDIKRMLIPTSFGIVPISSIADIKKTFGPTAIDRKDDSRIITITASGEGRAMDRIMADVQSAINSKVFIPSGFSINYSGDYEDMQDAFAQLLQAIILALVLVYAVMATQFESYIAPFVIALAIPFGFAGSILLLLITRQTLSVYSGIGIIVLIGVVVNNGIVLIDYMNQLMQEKKINGDEAAMIAGPRRLRPVLMTSLTTILGLLPMALSSGSGNEMYRPLALALLGGLTISTMFTLVIVPTVYAAIRNRIPLKDYAAKDIESIEKNENIDDALGTADK